MTHASEFIVLAVTKVGDKSLVVHTLSPEWGRRSFITGVSRKAPMAMFMPLSVIEGEVTENPKSDLWRLREVSAPVPLNGIRNNVSKNSMTLFMSEVLMRTLRDGANEPGLFDWCRRSILKLDAISSDYANYHLRFLLEFAGALGFAPTLADLAPFAGEQLGVVKQLLSLNEAECMLIPMTGVQRNAVAGLLLDYIGYHTDSRISVRSLAVLRELYG